MNARHEILMSSAAATLVLFSAMIDPRLSVGLAVTLFVLFSVVKACNSRNIVRPL
jgi:hypothetical protein